MALTHNISSRYRPFHLARAFVHTLKIGSSNEWRAYSKSKQRPADIPSQPDRVYLEYWRGWGDFLGTRRIPNQLKKFRSFEEAREYVRSLNIRSEHEWRAYIKSDKLPKDVPRDPRGTYSGFWKGMGDWLGTGRVASQNRIFRPYKEAREFTRCLGLRGELGWRKYCNSGEKPSDIPYHPDRTYKQEWTNLSDWLGDDTLVRVLK